MDPEHNLTIQFIIILPELSCSGNAHKEANQRRWSPLWLLLILKLLVEWHHSAQMDDMCLAPCALRSMCWNVDQPLGERLTPWLALNDIRVRIQMEIQIKTSKRTHQFAQMNAFIYFLNELQLKSRRNRWMFVPVSASTCISRLFLKSRWLVFHWKHSMRFHHPKQK